MFVEAKPNPQQNTITMCVNGLIEINKVPFTNTLLIPPNGEVRELSARTVQDLSASDLSIWSDILNGQFGTGGAQSGDKPEVLIIGTGNRQAFLPPSVLAPFYQAGIGVECMTSGAAARSYNVLISEDRRVLALILLPTEDN